MVIFSQLQSKNLSDLPENLIGTEKFAVGTSHTGRVIGYDSLHGNIILTFKKSVVENPLFSFDDITVGQVVTVSAFFFSSFLLFLQLIRRRAIICCSGSDQEAGKVWHDCENRPWHLRTLPSLALC